jgi:putative tryptophan/tyrosine transport system substrate-binding protein
MRRREFFTVLGSAVAWPLAARAQQPLKAARIGLLGPGFASGAAASVEGFRAGLRDLGYVEGGNIVIEFRWADGYYERLPQLAAELVRLNVDVLVAVGAPSVIAAKRATTTIPIVMAHSADAVRLGLVDSLNRPGGNVTGNTFFMPELNAKRLEFLKDALPGSSRIAVLLNANSPITPAVLETMGLAAKSLNLDLQQFEVQKPDEFATAFSAMGTRRADAVVVVDDPITVTRVGSIVELATALRLPSIGFLELAEAGGLMAYGVNFVEMFRRVAVFVDKIIKGAKPDELPVEQPTRIKFVINLKTANALGLTIPHLLFARADEVIE